jgi:acetylglutamate kinase
MPHDPHAAAPTVVTEPGAGLESPLGFRFANAHAGIKRTRVDVGAIVSDPPAAAAGCFTRNPIHAACVARNRGLLPRAEVQAVIVNSGNANAMTGDAGREADAAMAAALAEGLDCEPEAVLTGSTGMIGVPLNVALIAKATPKLLEALSPDPMPFAEAIITTDTCTKVASLSVQIPGATSAVRILGVAKGSGMIHPNMATTLAYVTTDAAIGPEPLQRLLREHIETTFNAITVDGDTSTNDTVLALANGASGVFVEGEGEAAFSRGLHAVLRALAIQVARDGEGATRLLQVDVTGAPDRDKAKAMARGIVRGSLFKCSVFVGESEWGRLSAAAGQAALEHGFVIEASKLQIRAQGQPLVENGLPVQGVNTADLHRRLRSPDVRWELQVGDGPGRFTAWGCDLSYDYVRINADETRQIEVSPSGAVVRNLSLASYSPRLKHQLLVEGLAYVRRFTGLRAMVYLHGSAAAARFDLVASLAKDLELTLDAGLRPLAVVPTQAIADVLVQSIRDAGHYVAEVSPDPGQIGPFLDRGHLCVLVRGEPDPGEIVELAIRLGLQKVIALGDDQGLMDGTGLVSVLGPELLLTGLDRGRFATTNPEMLALARHAARRGVPALHLIDGRVPHALVAELFTDQGIGTLVTRIAVG